jgi:hypothetical protein
MEVSPWKIMSSAGSSAPRFPWKQSGRFSSRKKRDVVLRVLRGDDLDLVSQEAGITG